MVRIVIRDLAGGQDRRSQLWTFLGNNGINPWKILDSQRAYIILINDDWIENILDEDLKKKARDMKYEIITPIEYNSKKTIVVKDVDKELDKYTDQEIKAKIENDNPPIKIQELVTLGNNNYRVIKLRLETVNMAKTAIEKGLLVGNQSIPSRMIESEIFVKLTPCYNCYAYDHKTRDCPKEK